LEKILRKKIIIKGKAGFHQEQFSIVEIWNWGLGKT
jgi:hypothetical protein